MGKKADEFKQRLSNVAQGAANVAHEAVVVGLEKSTNDGSKQERSEAVTKLKAKSKETWGQVDGVKELKVV
jgi:hypothetical protein